jgi:hypothetical protein
MNDMESIRNTRGFPPGAGTGLGAGFSAVPMLDLDGFAGNRKSLTKRVATDFRG